MIDRTTKLLLAAIAIGLFFNAISPLIQTQDDYMSILEGLKKEGYQVRLEVTDGEESH